MMDEVLGGRTDEESQSFSSFILSPSFFPRVPLAVPYWSGATYRNILRCLISGHIIDGSELGKLRSQVIETLGVADAVMTPLRSPVSGEENNVKIVKEGGFIWAEGEIATNERIKVEAPEISFDLSGRHSVFAPFQYAN